MRRIPFTLLALALASTRSEAAVPADSKTACKCAETPDVRSSMLTTHRTTAFIGKVLRVKKVPGCETLVTLKVMRVWGDSIDDQLSGTPEHSITIGDQPFNDALSFPFVRNRSYLVYADMVVFRTADGRSVPTFVTHCCTRTRPLAKAAVDIQALDEMFPPGVNAVQPPQPSSAAEPPPSRP